MIPERATSFHWNCRIQANAPGWNLALEVAKHRCSHSQWLSCRQHSDGRWSCKVMVINPAMSHGMPHCTLSTAAGLSTVLMPNLPPTLAFLWVFAPQPRRTSPQAKTVLSQGLHCHLHLHTAQGSMKGSPPLIQGTATVVGLMHPLRFRYF